MTRPVPGSIVIWRGPVGGTCNDAHHAARCGNLACKRDIMQQETNYEWHTNNSASHCAGLTLSCDDQRPTCITKLKEIGASGMLRTASILEDGADYQIRWAIRGKG